MAGPRVPIQLVNGPHDLRSNGIEMNVPDQFQKIGVFLTEDGFVAVLVEIAGAMMAVIEVNSIAGEEASHQVA